MSKYILWLNEQEAKETKLTGGKGASLANMKQELPRELNVPGGFVLTTEAYDKFISENNLKEKINIILSKLDKKDFSNLKTVGKQIRELRLMRMPKDIKKARDKYFESQQIGGKELEKIMKAKIGDTAYGRIEVN